LLGGPSTDTKQVLALGTGQRNLSAGFIIATGSFADQPNVLVFLAAAGLVGMFTLFPTAAEFGKRSKDATPEPATEPETAPGSAETSVPNQP
jgi:BASS family bile acid:Na+ symporter